MSRVPDRRKLRRNYLADKVAAYLAATVCTALFLPAVMLTVGCLAAAVWVLGSLLLHFSTSVDAAGLQFVALTGVSSFSAGLAWIFWHGIREAAHDAQHVEYVPPFDLARVPVDELLVRGHNVANDVAADTLLRSAVGQIPEAPEQLLRVAGNRE
jgi:hypothetical protein